MTPAETLARRLHAGQVDDPIAIIDAACAEAGFKHTNHGHTAYVGTSIPTPSGECPGLIVTRSGCLHGDPAGPWMVWWEGPDDHSADEEYVAAVRKRAAELVAREAPGMHPNELTSSAEKPLAWRCTARDLSGALTWLASYAVGVSYAAYLDT